MMPEPIHPDEEGLRLQLLVLRCQAGDERAFAQLFDRFSERTLMYLQGLVNEDAEDVQQEVWLSVYRRIGGLSNPNAFRTWLFQATRHRAIDFLRARTRESRLIEQVALEEAAGSDQTEDTTGTPTEFDLAGAARDLPALQREALLLRYQNDMSYAEIALIVGCSIGTVKSRLHEAKRRMQGMLKPR